MKPAIVTGAISVAVLVSAAFAQQPSPTGHGQRAAAPRAEVGATTQPNRDIQRIINSLRGTWAITAKLEPTPKMPNGGHGWGIEKWRAGPGNGSAIEDVTLSTPTWKLSLMAISWWDERAHGIRSLVCRASSPPGCAIETGLGKWKDGQLVFQSEYERNGKRYKYREVWSNIKTTSFTQTTYQGEAGGELRLAQTIQAKRVSSSEQPKANG